jgi:Tol biopolymer transport system component
MTDLPPRLVAALEGRYTLKRELGAGGMATVYLAHDVRHDRDVALKVLKPELAAVMGGERFLSEIRTTANLQHPHILPLYDSGEADSFLFYVMPYVEGETLRDRLAREKQLSVEETIRIAKAVGNALDFAHRKGVVHRDIKPANILLQDGQPLVADFGIALAVAQAGGGRLTETGLSLGTPHYMSPEQASADRDPDARSDVYSLACVVYEMLTGEPPHLGGSAQAVLARILTETARSVRATRPTVPAHVDATLIKALQKLPADRFDTAADFLAALEGRIVVDTGAVGSATGVGAASAGGQGGASRASRPWLVPSLVAGAVVVGAAGGWLARAPKPAPTPPVVSMYVEGDSTFQVTNACCGPSLAVSQDGRRIVFMARVSSGQTFYRRDLSDPMAHRVLGTDSAYTPFLDPTGRWLGFAKNNQLMKVDLTGGSPVSIGDVGTSSIWGATWGDDGFIYYVPQVDPAPGIFRVSAQGGKPELVSAPDTSAEADRVSPAALPGGRGLLYVSWPRTGGDAAAWVEALDLKDHSVHRLAQGIQPYYADGHLVYALADGSVMARPFDLESLEVTGDAVRIGENVITHNASDTEYAVSRSGTLVTRHGGTTGGRHSATGGVGETGASTATMNLVPLTGPPPLKIFEAQLTRGMPTFSPDDRYLAFLQARDANATAIDLWVMDLESGLPTRISIADRDAIAISPVWSADSRNVRWIQLLWPPGSVPSGRMLTRPVDLSGPPVPFAPEATVVPTNTLLSSSGSGTTLGLPSRAGGPIPYQTLDSVGNLDLWVMNADGTDPRPFLQSPANEMMPAVSPSGKWIAYASDETGQDELWVQPFPDGGPRFRISDHGGDYPVWVSDHQIAFTDRDVVVLTDLDVTPKQVRATGYRTFVDDVSTDWNLRPLDVRPDGKAVIVVKVTGTGRLLVETHRVQQIGKDAGGS